MQGSRTRSGRCGSRWDYTLGAVHNVAHGLPVDTTALDPNLGEAKAGNGTKDVFDEVAAMLLRDAQNPRVRLPWNARPLPVPRSVRFPVTEAPFWSLEGG